MNTLICKDVKNLKRKEFMDPLAESNGIDPKKFKNKHLLKKAIIDKGFENATDPITLQKICEIDRDKLITWTQDNKWYAADVESMFNYLKTSTINPWAIDKATGIMHSLSKVEYLERFDMKNVYGLIEDIEQKYATIKHTIFTEIEVIPEHVIQRDAIEKSGDGLYISHIIDFFETTKDNKLVIAILHDTMFEVIQQYAFQLDFSDLETSSLDVLSILDQMFLALKINYRKLFIDKSPLCIASEFFEQCSELLNPTVIERIFDVADATIKKYHEFNVV